MVVRLALLDHHYRDPWDWHDDLLARASDRLERWRGAGATGDAGLDGVRAALDDDLDLPRALAIVDDEAAAGRGIGAAAELVGVALS